MSQPLFTIAAPHCAKLAELIDVVPRGTVSRTLVKLPDFKQVAFAMDAGQELSEHRSPMLVIVEPIDGRLRVVVSGEAHTLVAGDWLLMPPDAPHAVHADKATRFLLTMVTVPKPGA
jgi:quercetin dioxygenase-like cupin family protein